MRVSLFIDILFTGGYILETILLGIFLCSNLFEKERGKISAFRNICALVLFMDAIATLFGVVLAIQDNWTDYTSSISRTVDGFVFFLVFVAGDTMVKGSRPSWKTWLLYGLPYVAIFIWRLIDKHDHLLFTGIAIAVVTSLFYLKMFLSAFLHDRKLKDKYSNFEGHTTRWYLIVAIMILTDMFVWFINPVMNISGYWISCLYNVFMLSTWILFASFAIKQKEPVIEASKADDTQDDASESHSMSLAQRLQTIMNEENAYLNSDLTIDTLAKALNTNSTYISKCLHEELNTSFYEYVNGKRIEFAQKQLLESDEKIEAIAILSGFNSSRAFLRVFKQTTGQTPTEWKTSNKAK